MSSLTLLAACALQVSTSLETNPLPQEQTEELARYLDHSYGDPLPNSCVGLEDGSYWFLLSTTSDSYMPVYLTCSNEYMILDVNQDPQLANYFSSYEMWHRAIAGPSNEDPCTWEEWFLPNEGKEVNTHARFLLSPQCDVCDAEAERQVFNHKTTYWMSGNLAKLTWQFVGYNDCDMDVDTYSCFDCSSCRDADSPVCNPTVMSETDPDWSKTGICGTAVQRSDRKVEYTRTMGMLHRTKPHYKPSLGTDGRFCVCYQPSDHRASTYTLSDAQEEYLEAKMDAKENEEEQEEENTRSVSVMSRVDGYVDENAEFEDLRESNIVHLRQEDFAHGTYRIRKSGTYILQEDVAFDFNAEDDYWPRADQNTEDLYPGAAQYRDPYFMGFFAGITVEADYVTIDLNGFELKQSLKFYYQQRWFAIIELGSQQFLPGQGPGFFGPNAVNVAYCTVKDGILGLSSHFAVHGNFPAHFRMENVHIKDFVTHGMQLNGWKELELDNVEIGPSSRVDFLRGDYGHARLMSFRLRDLENDLIADGTLDQKTITFDGRQGSSTLTDVADALDAQMELALNHAINKATQKNAENDYLDPALLNLAEADEEERETWQKAKELFVHESGYPSSSSLTGIFLNFDGASVFTYTKYTNRKSSGAKINNLYIHDLTHEMYESLRIGARAGSGTSRMYTSPWLSDFPAQSLLGSKERLLEFRKASRSRLIPDLSSFRYVGSVVTDAYIALGTFCDDWGYLGQELLFQTTESESIAFWATGENEASGAWSFGCNQDVMFHSGKGTLGLRVDGTDNVEINGLKIENLLEKSDVGSLACGEYSGSSRNTMSGEGGHLKQQAPIQIGFSGNNLQGVSVVSSTNLRFKGKIEINNIESETGEGAALSFWTATDVVFDDDAVVVLKNVKTGSKLEPGTYHYQSLPNRSPEACGMRLETDESSELYDSSVTFAHSEDSDNKGLKNVVVCNVAGHESCLGDDTNGNTLFGTYLGDDGNLCDGIETLHDIQSFTEKLDAKLNPLAPVKADKSEETDETDETDEADDDEEEADDDETDAGDSTELADKPNIIMIMLDDLGRADIGYFGAEWDTPNIDSFITSSISLTHHYIGYVCSASRSQFLTGRHSFHNGYGTLDVFDRAKLGGIPKGTPTVADYLKTYGGYRTYAVGKWQLGYSFPEQTPNYRGFDYFWGFYGGLEDYFDKTATIRSDTSDSKKIKKDKTEYYDFWENMSPYYDAAGEYSTYQYLTKLTEIIDTHNELDEDDYKHDEPFFIYAALQAPHMPFPDQDTEFGTTCDTIYDKYYNEMDDRDGVCEGMLGLDYFMGSLIDYFADEDLQDVWDNTLIIFTSDNGGALSHGSCNYPLRGGKNTYFEGNQRVHTFVGGGYIPESERGSVRSGLFSNVDWLPTMLSFGGVVPHDYYAFGWNHDLAGDSDVPFTFDGYNQYEYLMSSDASPLRDHVMFQLRPALDNDSNWDDSEEVTQAKLTSVDDATDDLLDSMNIDEIALVFYDTDGKLWKYFNAEESTNEIGNVEANCNWCKKANYGVNSENSDEKYIYTTISDSVTKGLYDLSTDMGEEYNLYETLDEDSMADLLSIVAKNAVQYFNEEYSESSIFLYGNFDCFYKKYNKEAWPINFHGLWKPFLEADEFADKLLSSCGFDDSHTVYKLHTSTATFVDEDVSDLIVDRTELVAVRNSLVSTEPVMEEMKRQKRIFMRNKEESLFYNENSETTAATKANSAFTLVSVIALASVMVLIGAAIFVNKYCWNSAKREGYEPIA